MTPQRLLLTLGVPLGVLMAMLLPAWTGYDEMTHFARAVDMATGVPVPEATDRGVGSVIPATYVEGVDLVILNFQAGNDPWTISLTGDLLAMGTDGRSAYVDTRPTGASTPLAYIPAAAAMVVPVNVDAAGVIVLWAGRLGSLAAYLALAWAAVRSAARFRWTLVVGALLPLNLSLGSSVSPDGLTIASLLVMLSMWTRVEEDESVPAWQLVGGTLLLALAKPPYFLVLALFPFSAVRRRSAPRIRAAWAASGAMLAGLAATLANASDNYRAVTTTLMESIEYQPGTQRDRLLADLPGFLWAALSTWVSEFHFYVQNWFRQLGSWEADFPAVASWVCLAVLVTAVLRLDEDDYRRCRGLQRSVIAVGAICMLVVLYASSHVYFTDRADYATIGLQMARYAAPLTALALIGWTPRLPAGRPALTGWLGRREAKAALAAAVTVPVLASAATWLWLGDDLLFG